MPHSTAVYAQHRIFLLEETTAAPFPDGYIRAYFAEAASTEQALWQSQQGVFLFLRGHSAALNLPAVETALRDWLRNPLHAEVRLLWIENPQAPLINWRTHSLSLAAGGGRVTQNSYFDFRNYAFSIAADTEVRFTQGEGFTFTRAAGQIHAFEFSAGYGETRLYNTGDTVSLPLHGPGAGCLRFDLRVLRAGTAAETFGYPALTALDAGFRMFFRDPDFPEAGQHYYLSSHRYPLLQESSVQAHGYAYYPPEIAFQVSLDPLYPLAGERTCLTFAPLQGRFAETGLPSAWRTTLGYSAHLIPADGRSRLQFALRPALRTEAARQTEPFYLAPAGDFHVRVPRYHADGRTDLLAEAALVCGISGVEYIKIAADPVPTLRLEPDMPALAEGFISVSALLRDLPALIRSYSQRDLPPDTRDLDIRIEDKEEGEAEEAMGITDTERRALLNLVRQNYFPPGYRFSEQQLAQYDALEYIEDLIDWLQDSLLAAQNGAGTDSPLAAYPVTSWVYLRNGNGMVYYAQPEQAVLYRAEQSSTRFLDYLEIPSLGLPDSLTAAESARLLSTTGNGSLAFPMLPYGNLDPRLLSDYRALELILLNTYRRNRIQAISAATQHRSSLQVTGQAVQVGTTPQGLIATYSGDRRTIQQLQLARDTKDRLIPFLNIDHGSVLKASLQSNQLFMVVSKPDAVTQYFSREVLATVPGATSSLDIQDWIFELGPEHWNLRKTLLIFKFHDKPLLELAGNPDFWSFPGSFNRDAAEASRNLVRLLREAVDNANHPDPKIRRKYEVLARAATQANWTGVLALNVHVPLRNLPDALKALAAGMDPNLFYAQYVGVEVTQVTSDGNALRPQQSSLFGLIDYSNPQIPTATPSGYNFHVPSLSVVFQNAQIVDFNAEILLVMDRLFGEATTLYDSPDGLNILRLKGVAEEHNGKVTYSFGFSGANHFVLSGKVVEEVEIWKAQFVTDPLPQGNPDPLTVQGRFFFWGRLRFAYLPAMDALSFGALPGGIVRTAPKPGDPPAAPDYLSLSNLQIVMRFVLEQEANLTRDLSFRFQAQQMSFDLNRSGWRRHSLYEKFPLRFSGFRVVEGDANALKNSGFMPVSSPLGSPDLGQDWYALTFELNLGSLGALAGSTGLKVSIMAAWVPGKEGVWMGLKLPGSTGGKKEITLQGLLKLAFQKIQFIVYPLNPNAPATLPAGTEAEVGYLLKIKNITLKFFAVSFPPVGQSELVLFGDSRSNVARDQKLLGWYGAYAR